MIIYDPVEATNELNYQRNPLVCQARTHLCVLWGYTGEKSGASVNRNRLTEAKILKNFGRSLAWAYFVAK